MAKHFRAINGQRASLESVAKQIREQQLSERDHLTQQTIGRPFDLPPTMPINARLNALPRLSVRYQHRGHIGVQYLRRSDVGRAIEAGLTTTRLMQEAIDSLGGTALASAVVERGALQIAPERPVTNNSRAQKLWLVAEARQTAVMAEDAEQEVDLAEEQAVLHECLQIPQTYDAQLLWLGAISAPSIERAEFVLPLLEEEFPRYYTTSKVQFLPTHKRPAYQPASSD